MGGFTAEEWWWAGGRQVGVEQSMGVGMFGESCCGVFSVRKEAKWGGKERWQEMGEGSGVGVRRRRGTQTSMSWSSPSSSSARLLASSLALRLSPWCGKYAPPDEGAPVDMGVMANPARGRLNAPLAMLASESVLAVAELKWLPTAAWKWGLPGGELCREPGFDAPPLL